MYDFHITDERSHPEQSDEKVKVKFLKRFETVCEEKVLKKYVPKLYAFPQQKVQNEISRGGCLLITTHWEHELL